MRHTYQLNKKNILIITIVIIIIGLLGTFFFISPDTFVSSFIRSKIFIKYVGLIISLSSIPFLIGHLMLLKDNYGLKITDQGFVNNTNLTNVGIVHWTDITSIERKSLKVNSILLVRVKNEEEYYSKIKNPLKKLNILIYRHSYGASFVIEPKNIIGSLEEIELTLQDHLNEKSS